MSGYTAKIAGTEEGIKEPKPVFSTCFAAPFIPLPAATYAEMFGKKIREHHVNVWMINTGWIGGPYGVGKRIKLACTRAMINAALEGKLDNVAYEAHPVFRMLMPKECPGVPAEVLNPRNTWKNKNDYDKEANSLARQFIKNFEKFPGQVEEEILEGAPVIK